MVYCLLIFQRKNRSYQKNTLSILSKKLITVNGGKYIVLGTVSVSSGYNTDQLKKMWALADTVLKNGDLFYICMKIIDAEFEMVK